MPPGTMKRTSRLRSGVTPSTAGTTRGRSSSETKHSAGRSEVEDQGRRRASVGGVKAAAKMREATSRSTAILSSGMGRPPSAMWNTPAVVRRSLAGLCSTPLTRR